MRVWKLLPLLTALLFATLANAGHTWHYNIQGWNHTSFDEEVINIAAGAASQSFKTWDMSSASGTNPVADAADDTIYWIEGAGITITGSAGGDSITIASTVTDEVGAITANDLCRADGAGSQVICDITSLADLEAALTPAVDITDSTELAAAIAAADFLPITGGDLDGPGDLALDGRFHLDLHGQAITFPAAGSVPDVSDGSLFRTGVSSENVGDFGWDTVGQITAITDNGSGNARVEATAHGLSSTNKVTIAGTANYNGWYTITKINDNFFDLDTAYISDAGALGSFGLRASDAGQVISVKSRGNITYQCYSGQLACGSQNIQTSAGDETFWLSRYYDASTVAWQLIGIIKADQFYSDNFITEVGPRFFGTTHLGDTGLTGYLETGPPYFFAKDAVTPNVTQGVSFYSWECVDSYNRHCVDLYDSRANSPCGDYQCSGSPDGLCDSDGTTSWTEAPSRVLTPLDIDLFALGTGNTIVTAPEHHLDAVDEVTIAGTTSYDGDWTIGDVLISSASVAEGNPDDNIVEVTSVGHGLIGGENIQFAGITHQDYDGQWVVSHIDDNTFQMNISPGDWTSTTSALIRSLDRFTIPDTYAGDESSGATYLAVDNYCDADAATDYTAATNSPTTIRGFSGGVDNQLIMVSVKDNSAPNPIDEPTAQALYFECACTDTTPADDLCDYDGVTPYPGKLRCGDSTWPPDPQASTSIWRYDEPGDYWQIVAFGRYSSINYAAFDEQNTWTKVQTFEAGTIHELGLTSQDQTNLVDDVSFGNFPSLAGDMSPNLSGHSTWSADQAGEIYNPQGMSIGDIEIIQTTIDGVDYDCDGSVLADNIYCGTVNLETDRHDVTGWIRGIDGSDARLLFHFDDDIDMNLAHYALTSEVAAGYLPLSGGTLTGGLTIETGGLTIEDGATNGTVLDYDSDGFSIRPHADRSIYIGNNAGNASTVSTNVFIGSEAGAATTGGPNVFIGANAGKATVGGTRNVYIGGDVGRFNVAGNDNTVLGRFAGDDPNASYGTSTIIGAGAGGELEDGANNLFFGYQAGAAVTSGDDNTLFSGGSAITSGNRNLAAGREALGGVSISNDSIGLGFRAGRNTSGTRTTLVGVYSMGNSTASAGTDNTFFGAYSGYSVTDGSRNLFLGPYAGYHQTTASDYFIVDNRNQGTAGAELTDALIVGTFNADPTLQTLDFNAAVTVSEKLTVEADGTGTFGTYDAEFGSGDYAAIRLGSGGIYSSSFATGNIDLGKTMVFRQEQAVDGILEFAWIESGNTLRAGIPESGAGNAANFFRSFMIAGPYSAATGDNHFICDTHTPYNGNIDCDTGTSGPDMLVGDDLEVLGTGFFHETINFEGTTADGNHVILAVDDPAADVTHTFPAATGRLANDDRKCVYVKTGLTTGLQLESVWPAHKNFTVKALWCETDAGTAGMDFNIDDGTPAAVNGSDISCSTTPTWDQVLAGDVDLDQGDRLDLDIGTVATATRLTACFDIALD